MHPTTTVRFAPSPTGALHIGGIRTLLYNYLFAKKKGGTFLLRMEDTDQKRLIPSSEAYITESLHWLGIVPDAGPLQGGKYGPYRQSERTALYQHYLQPLLAGGYAYYAFDTAEELEALRERMQAAKATAASYNAVSRGVMKNSFTLPASIVTEWIASGKPYVIRLKMPHKETIRFYDLLRGWVKVETATLDDKVLLKADGLPTYHFANVIDDYLMQVTHVIRGEEWLPSTPLHVLLYRYLGWETAIPQFVHLPLLLSPDGKGKLSKRKADQYGFPVFPIAWQSEDLTVKEGFREKGYLPEAIWNFLALLGWNPGNSQEVFTKEALIEAFSLERLGKSSVQFDITKANWFNRQHIQKQPAVQWVGYFQTAAAKEHIYPSETAAIAICTVVQERVTFPEDFWKEGSYFLLEPLTYDANLLQQKWNKQTEALLLCFMQALVLLTKWEDRTLKQTLQSVIQGEPLAAFLPILRMALTGRKTGPDLIAIMRCMGKENTYKRIHSFLAQTSNQTAR
ncbi:MAG: glutamate--tRNA ligase [Candidatus Cardinium sp.]|nr:glutamate--tRNA ligase [Candidatus Cardinium sp.]